MTARTLPSFRPSCLHLGIDLLHRHRRDDVRFSRRSLREAINWGDTQTKLHLSRLVELEYLVAQRTKTGGFDYELVYDVADGDAEGSLRFPGLADIEGLRCAYDATRSGHNDARSAPRRWVVGVTKPLQSQHPCGSARERPAPTTKCTAPRRRSSASRTRSPSPPLP